MKAFVLLCLLVVVGVSTVLWFTHGPAESSLPQQVAPTEPGVPSSTGVNSERAQGGLQSEDEPPRETKRVTLTPRAPSPASAPFPAASSARAEPSAQTRQLVSALAKLEVGHGPLSAEQAANWKQTLQQLAQQGGAAVPAIREFLGKNSDISFDAPADKALLGYPSLRLALMQTMQNAGGPEALETSAQLLQTTADPREIATLIKYLDQTDPGKYGDTALNAAREALAMAATPKWDGRDVTPLLEVLKQYGGATAVADLQNLSKTWFDYAPMALAGLPDGAGVPALIEWVKQPDAPSQAGNDTYLRMLAQASLQSPDAFSALLEQAAANRISAYSWSGIASALGGSTMQMANTEFSPSPMNAQTAFRYYHISSGNQSFVEVPPASMPSDVVSERLALVDRLIGSTTSPNALETLQSIRTSLSARLR